MSSGRHASLPKTSPKIVPVHLRPRTRSSVTIRHLPPEILTRIFKGMHITDLLSLGRESGTVGLKESWVAVDTAVFGRSFQSQMVVGRNTRFSELRSALDLLQLRNAKLEQL